MAKIGIIQDGCVATLVDQTFGGPLRANCPCSRITTHDPSRDYNKHTMHVHIATDRIRMAIQVLSGAPPVAPPKLGRWDKPCKAHLPKEETMSNIRPRIRIEFVDDEVKYFLAKCEEHRCKGGGTSAKKAFMGEPSEMERDYHQFDAGRWWCWACTWCRPCSFCLGA